MTKLSKIDISPPFTLMNPKREFNNVVFPQPLGPINAVAFLSLIFKFKFWNTGKEL